MADLFNIESEIAVLAAIWINPGLTDYAAEKLDAGDFHEPLFGRLFQSTLDHHAAGVKTPVVKVANDFRGDAALDSIGGVPWIFTQTEDIAATVGFYDFVGTVADLANRRRLKDGLAEATTVLESEKPIGDAISIADAAMWTASKLREGTMLVSGHDAIGQSIERMKAIRENRHAGGVVLENIKQWSQLLGPMSPGQMIVCGARPGMGKTAVACSIANGAAFSGHGVLYVSLEMSAQELGDRMISDLCYRQSGGVRFDHIQSARVTDAELDRIEREQRRIADWPYAIVDTAGMTIGKLAMTVRRQKRKFESRGQKLELVIVDYLQLLRSDRSTGKRYDDVSEISMAIKEIAKECGVAMLALSQLSRAVEQREDKRPMLSDLRESGQIEQDANAVIFLYREEYYLKQSEPDKANVMAYEKWLTMMQACAGRLDLICAKRRNGPTGADHVFFFPEYQAVRGRDYFQNMEFAA